MKILTKEEEQAHYKYPAQSSQPTPPSNLLLNNNSETIKGGAIGGTTGLLIGVLGVYGAGIRYPAFRHLTLPLRAFLCTSGATFGAIITADRFSRAYESSRHPDEGYQDEAARVRAEQDAKRSSYERFMSWGKDNRYPIVGVSWVLSMGIALGIVGRSPYLSTQQKLVQARVYAQTLTIAVLIATATFEVGDREKGEGRWETVKIVDPDDPTHKHLIDKKVHHERYAGEDQWRDMVEAEERRIKQAEGKPKHKEHHHKHKEHHEKRKSEKDGGDKD